MHCIFPTCDNDDSSHTLSHGITFYRFPEDAALCAAWIEAIGVPGWKPEANSVICSSHFLTEDLLFTRSGPPKLRPMAVPIDNIKVCRICFAKDCKLYPLKNNMYLDKAYETLTGLLIEQEDKLPQYLCIQCANRVLNCVRFRDRCLRAHSILIEIMNDNGYISLESIIAVNSIRSPFSPHVAHNQTDIEHSCIKNSNTEVQGDIKNEDFILDGVKMEHDDIMDPNILITDIRSNNDMWCYETRHDVVERANEDILNKNMENNNTINDGEECLPSPHENNIVEYVATVSNNNLTEPDNVKKSTIDPDMEVDDLFASDESSMNETLSSKNAGQKVKRIPVNEQNGKDLKQTKDGKHRDQKCQGGIIITYKSLSCDLCSFQTISRTQLMHHLKSHAAIKLYNCNKCYFITNSKKNLHLHVKTHSDAKPYWCDICNKQFSYRHDLVVHLRKHSGEKPYSCDVCKKKFTQYNQLKAHLRIHCGEKPYSCNVCDKIFRQMGQLQSHLRIHTGEKPYSCNICNKGFIQKGQLQSHLRIHTGEKPYSCNICNKSFVQRGQLQNHIRVHSVTKSH